jgi:hypothetical protein
MEGNRSPDWPGVAIKAHIKPASHPIAISWPVSVLRLTGAG